MVLEVISVKVADFYAREIMADKKEISVKVADSLFGAFSYHEIGLNFMENAFTPAKLRQIKMEETV